MADETEKKFIFTADGRKLLVSQVGGIKFAVLGVALVYTEKTLVPEEPEADFNLTLDDLSLENNVVLGLKKIYYTTVSIPDNDDYGSIAPEDTNKYINALNDLEKYLIPVHYKPTLEKQDQFGNAYGTYDFDVDKTTISWDMYNNIAFKYIVLFGKQYAETSDATFNVNKTQKPTVIGIVKYPENSVIIFNKEASDYCAEKVQLTFTITDIDEKCELDIASEEVLEASKKLSLINNGLYTRDADDPEVGVSMNIAGTKTIIEDLDLDASGALAMTKTLMVAEKTNGTELVEQLNPGSMVHIVNNEIKDESTEKVDYKPQLIFTTIEGNQDVTQEITAYNTIFSLRGKGNDLSTNDGIISGTESPIFELNSIPTNDYYAVNIFGNDNKILENENRNIDVMLFSNSNSSINPASVYNRNVLLFANTNTIQDESYGNLLLGAENTTIKEGSYNNIIINRKTVGEIYNTFASASYNTIIGTNDTIISADTDHLAQYNTIIGGGFNKILNSSQNILLSLGHLITDENGNQIIMGKYNTPCSAAFIFGYGNQGQSTRNLMELYENGELKLFNSNGRNTVTLGGDAGIQLSNLAVTSFSADYGYFNKRLYVGNPGGNGYPYKGLHVDYTSASNDLKFNISQGRTGANLIYDTTDHTLIIEDAHQSVNSDRTKIKDEYASFEHLFATEGAHGYSESDNILINGNITGTNNIIDELGTLTVHNFYKEDNSSPGIGNKVNVKSDKIEFNTYDENTYLWNNTLTIDPINYYSKIVIDIGIYGSSYKKWSPSVLGVRGTPELAKVFMTDLFNYIPPIGYTTAQSYNDLADDNLYISYLGFDPNNADNSTWSTLDNNIKASYTGTWAQHCTSNINFIDINPKITNEVLTKIPDYLDEIEINIYTQAFDDSSFVLNWIPMLSNEVILREKPTKVKCNIIVPSESTLNVMFREAKIWYAGGHSQFSEVLITPGGTFTLTNRLSYADRNYNSYYPYYDTQQVTPFAIGWYK